MAVSIVGKTVHVKANAVIEYSVPVENYGTLDLDEIRDIVEGELESEEVLTDPEILTVTSFEVSVVSSPKPSESEDSEV